MTGETQVWKIEWDDGMSVGIPEIDEDHKHFIRLVNQLNQAVADRMSVTEIKNRLQLILDDAERHFRHEERLFAEWHYPDTDEHASRHNRLIEALYDISARSVPHDFAAEWIDVGLRIKEALIGHILQEDMKYAAFYRSRQAAAQA
ncbi:MAG: bacteriohemerythrin [Sideroxydans sp.]|nr:bacteriohemerythrin [Sideroxydans sp.]